MCGVAVGDLRSAAGLLAMMAQPGIGPGTALALAQHFESLEELAASSPAERRRAAGGRGEQLDPAVLVRSTGDGSIDGTVGYFDAAFPPRLRNIPSPPAVLWVRGTLPDPDAPAVAVVGTRQPTAWGIRTAERSVEALEGTRSVVVSGLALGIDGVAHRRALAVGLPTVAVLGSGVDAPTPREHQSLAEAILEAGGAVIAEVPPGTAPSAQTLVARNRLQSGLSDAVVVAQCGLGSGTLHTARFSLLQGRRLIVPRPTGAHAGESQSQGNLALIDGANPTHIKASKADAVRLAERERFADASPSDGDELDRVVRGVAGDRERRSVVDGLGPEQLMFGE